MSNPIPVVVRMSASNNRARAGNSYEATEASSTSSPRAAARRAAAKYLRAPEENIVLRRVQCGDVVRQIPEIYSARAKEVRPCI